MNLKFKIKKLATIMKYHKFIELEQNKKISRLAKIYVLLILIKFLQNLFK